MPTRGDTATDGARASVSFSSDPCRSHYLKVCTHISMHTYVWVLSSRQENDLEHDWEKSMSSTIYTCALQKQKETVANTTYSKLNSLKSACINWLWWYMTRIICTHCKYSSLAFASVNATSFNFGAALKQTMISNTGTWNRRVVSLFWCEVIC